MRIEHFICIVAGLLCILCLFSCHKQNNSQESLKKIVDRCITGERAELRDNVLRRLPPEEIAGILCHYSQNSIPFWFLLDDFKPWLSSSEKDAVAAIGDYYKSSLNASALDRRLSLDRFLADHIRCSLLQQVVQSAEPETLVFQFSQDIPNISRLESLFGFEYTGDWLNQFNAAFERSVHADADLAYHHDKTVVVLEKRASGWFLKSEVRDSYYRSLMVRSDARLLRQAVSRHHWPLARRVWQTLCLSEHGSDDLPKECLDFRDVMNQAEARWRGFERSVYRLYMSFPHWQRVAVSKKADRTVLDIVLFNSTNTRFDSVWIGYDHPSYKETCLLQSKMNFSDDFPLSVSPGSIVQGWCAIPYHEAPLVIVDAFISE